jgi:hypothetical protein
MSHTLDIQAAIRERAAQIRQYLESTPSIRFRDEVQKFDCIAIMDVETARRISVDATHGPMSASAVERAYHSITEKMAMAETINGVHYANDRLTEGFYTTHQHLKAAHEAAAIGKRR